ncbi:predicted protein [Naegleria gruberi]|uniref:Predicted protein n=1 Tax=Naegleria gruberi TaxID=5762 RepID=D2V354_NAEGR|nr:uncharacterized protein NAEGRDRAFT_46323 [Naegleria gruberi]EFC48572.1 predicted protein [Naegleria gruberi]|eukprot:XP_002681316.1 predicted protein [Naegleria gruberi strain NEG-M]
MKRFLNTSLLPSSRSTPRNVKGINMSKSNTLKSCKKHFIETYNPFNVKSTITRSFSINQLNRFSQQNNFPRTTFITIRTTCALCGHEGQFDQVTSTSSFGNCDLDMRPAPLARHTLVDEVQECESCGFVNQSVGKCENIEEMKNIVKSDKYQEALKDDNSFLLYALIKEEEQNYLACAWSYVKSAWIFDDRNENDKASISRRRAIEFFEKSTTCLTLEQKMLIVDLYRRTSQFDKASNLANDLLKNEKIDSKFLIGILEYQKDLCRYKDVDCHVSPDENKIFFR